MSARRTRREKFESRNRSRLRYLIAVLTLEDLQRCGVVEADFIEKPNATTIERKIDQRIRVFQQADAKLRKRSPPIRNRFPNLAHLPPMVGTKCTGVVVDELQDFDIEIAQ